MEPIELLTHLARIVRPRAESLIANERISSREANLRALGDLLDLLSSADSLKPRESEILDALWAVYVRSGKPVDRGLLAFELGDRMTYDETTLYRALKRMREIGFVQMVGKQWKPLFNPSASLEMSA